MYNISTIKANFFNLVKWRGYDNPNIPALDSSLTDVTEVITTTSTGTIEKQGIATVAALGSESVTFDTPFADTGYTIGGRIYDSTGTTQLVQITAKTVNGFTFTAIKAVTYEWTAQKGTSTQTTVTSGTSGLFYNDINPMLYPENLEKIFKHYDSYDYDEWAVGSSYIAGQKVLYDSRAYKAKQSTSGDQPDESPDSWMTLISQELIRETNDNTIEVVEQLLNRKKLNGLKPLMEDLRIFEGAGRIGEVIIKESRFVGISFALKKFNALQAQIIRMGAQFTQINTDLDIYVYHSSQKSPIKEFTISTTEINSFAWNAVSDCLLEYVKYTGYDTGMFFIGYYEDDLTGQAINKQVDFSKEPVGCVTCFNQIHNLYAYNLFNKYIEIKPFSVIYDTVGEMFDIEDISYYRDHNFGLNFHLTVECDITTLLTDNADRFVDVLRKNEAVRLLKSIAYSTRDNVFQDRLKDNAFTELKGVEGHNGLESQLNKAYDAIDLVMTIDSPCLGKKKRGIKSGAI